MELLAYAGSALLGIAVMFGPAVVKVAIRNRRQRPRFTPSPCTSCHHTGGWHDRDCPAAQPTNVRITRRSPC